VAHDPDTIGPDLLSFLTERHVATLTTLRPDGTPHVVPVGFTYDPETHLARVITSNGSVKVHNVRSGHGHRRVAVCQVDGRRWVTLEGTATVRHSAEAVAVAEERYAQRYRRPRENPQRVVLEISVDRISGHT
jgi:F420H(2)-dependent biliverdin reductase